MRANSGCANSGAGAAANDAISLSFLLCTSSASESCCSTLTFESGYTKRQRLFSRQYVADNCSQVFELFEAGRFPKIIQRRVFCPTVIILQSVGGRHHNHRNLRIKFRGSEAIENFDAAIFRQMHIEQEQVRSGRIPVAVGIFDEGDGLGPVPDHVENMAGTMIPKCDADNTDIFCRILSQQNLVWTCFSRHGGLLILHSRMRCPKLSSLSLPPLKS